MEEMKMLIAAICFATPFILIELHERNILARARARIRGYNESTENPTGEIPTSNPETHSWEEIATD